uniref:Dehydrogenase/reductase SDR family member 7 n=1 Tax=Aceria tosichella TaxID=561515 RepID=A0A6G1SDQ7_9ACAR
MFGTVLFLIIIGACAYGFSKLDCHVYLWVLDRFFMSPAYTNHLRGQVVWITGASSGIGEYMAYEFAEVGCKLVLSGTNQARLDAVKAKCLDLDSNLTVNDILVLPFDISNYAIHKTCLQQVLTHFQRIDILVNNAGRSQRANFERIDINVDEDMFRVNVFGPINLTREVVNFWKSTNQPGQVAVTSSVAGIFGAPYSSTYSATKFALHGYFECLRIEGYKSVKVTLLCPGPVHSRILESSYTEQPGVQVNQSHAPDSRRMSTERCAKLCLTAIVNRVNVAWISIQPALVCCYIAQYMPNVLVFIYTRFIGEEKFKKLRDGN